MKYSFIVPVYGTERYLVRCVDSVLAQRETDFEVLLVDDCSPDGAPARTDYTLLETRGDLSLLRLRLFTGRTHQIRVHLSALGCPVYGDRVYGAAAEDLDRPALHSAFLSLRQPVTGVNIDLESPLPADMEAVWKSMRSR